ncbi:Fur family transcriptional regulator [Acetivibrio ethanolgignens]|uniref:Fur family transcriptional regulator n=1 Tax=Acetivibrio ethanolgignens TaxID=290052 RepID=A0A0V8QDD5_9FIRM|nr:transcriptional repressor [Acetivibrio ethanolgignens]KSV58548.1 Fur family transcriptional regulator [Acetivibrio ethanolgignens]
MAELKYSRQREAIRTYLAETKEHPTAEMVYSAIRQTYPNISLGTVYRNLNLLVETGEINKLSCGDGLDHFDYDTSSHYHFVCTKCGRVIDLKMDSIDSINKAAGSHFDGSIDGHCTYFYGKCPHCINK